MNLLQRLLTHHPLVNILFLVVIVMGLMAYPRMPREQDPEVNFNWVTITTQFPGASTADVETLVTTPLEDALAKVRDIRWVTSTSRAGNSNILVRFYDLSEREFDKRINDLRREIQNAVNSELPQEVEDPRIQELSTSNGFPTALVAVTGIEDDEQLRRTAQTVEDDLNLIDGVHEVMPIGLHDPEIQVRFRPDRLASAGITASDIADQLALRFRDVNAGVMNVGPDRWLVRVPGRTADPEKLADYRILAPSGERFSLNDVAEVARARERPVQRARVGGRPAVVMMVTKATSANTLELVADINRYIESRNQDLAESPISLVLTDDQSVATRQSVQVMQTNAGLGMILVLGVCWVFLGLRIATLVTLGLAFSILGTIALIAALGLTLNQSVLLGIVIVLGMLVDDAVVVVEAVYYRIQRGAEALAAATGALREVAAPVTASVSTTIAAFLPLMLLPGIVGKFMFVIPLVVTLGLLISLVEAFWLLPAHVIDFAGRPATDDRRQDWRFRWTHWLRLRYGQLLCRVMRRPGRFFAAIALVLALAGAALWLGAVRMNFFTFDPMRIFYVNVTTPAGTTVDETLAQTLAAERRADRHLPADEIRAVTAIAGMRFSETEISYGSHFGQLQISLKPAENGSPSARALIDAMRSDLQAHAGDAEITFLEISGGPPVLPPVNVKVRNDDFETLRAATDAVARIVAAIPGARDIQDSDVAGSPELGLIVDQRAAGQMGIDPAQVGRLVGLHVDGEVVGFVRDRGEKVDLRVIALRESDSDVQALLADPVALPDGRMTTFDSLARPKISQTRNAITHYNRRRSITVSAELDEGGYDTVAANQFVVDEWAKIQFRYPGTDLDLSGELDDIEESLDAMAGLFVFGLGLIYLIIATQFRSYFQPLLILATVPMAFAGVVFGLLITRNPMSLYTLYGVIALTGIAVNSAIVLIDAANSRLRAGIRPLHATVYAARRRVIPVLMTATTTIAGLFSLAVGLGGKSLLWGPVASSIVAGLVFATALTLFVIPTLYRLFMRGHWQPPAPPGSLKPSNP